MTPPRTRRGVLVALEGIDGAGKTTLQQGLARRWRRAGFSVRTAREPSDVRIGTKAQEIGSASPWASALLFTVDRMAARPGIERWLARRNIVLQDRSFYSTLAYQGSALPTHARIRLELLERRLAILPDRVVLLDVEPSAGLARVRGRRAPRAPLERNRTLARVARAYRRLARQHHFLVLDGRSPASVLVDRADAALRPWLRRRLARRRPGR